MIGRRSTMPRTASVLFVTAIMVTASMVAGGFRPSPAKGAAPINGQIAFYSSRDGTDNIYLMNADGTGQTLLTDPALGHHGAPSWSRDGTQIAFHSTRDGNNEIYVMDADGTDQTRVTNNSANDAWAAWSPDGTQIAFSSNRDENWEIYVMNADGTNQTRVTNNTALDDKPAWSPDGTKIAFQSNADGDLEIYTMDVDGTSQTKLTTTFRSTYPAWSPDGTQIAFASYVNSGSWGWEIWTMNADGNYQLNRTNAVGGDFGPAWGALPQNAPPVADPDGPYLGAVNTPIALVGTASFDPDDDPLTYAWDFGDLSVGIGATPTHAYGAAGIYNVCLTVNDGSVDSAQVCTSAVVYDPSAGFVTGGGWFDSLEGAYVADEPLTGKATFGFVSKYKKGTSVPDGNTEFQFKAGNLNFHSSSYDWLVVTGSDYAMFKGTGTINGAGEYKFRIWAGDGSPDTFRIKIWTEAEFGVETIVYDNGADQPLGGGSIVIHTK